ncbi:hypothetical protein [Streptomyces sp. NPDC048106]|uniref:hypothetical protein n=1 Tax=Streptomyces sp. NPDC048106 TaxID=3155750 RepID=UPI003455545F
MTPISTSSTPDPSHAGDQALPDCAADPTRALTAMFVDRFQGDRIVRGQSPVERPVFLKQHGVAHGALTVRPDLPEELRVGFLKTARQRPEGLTAWVRFSSDIVPSRRDLRSTLGMGIKLFGVPGQKLLESDSDADTQDLLLQNHDVFFADTSRDMCEFIRSGLSGDRESYLQGHPVTRQILDAMAKVEDSALTATYWSVLPYTFGLDRFVKYKLVPAGCARGDPAATPADENPRYLADDLAHRLAYGQAAFDLLVQLRTDPAAMPLDRATVRWEERASPPIPVARLTLARQDVNSRGQAEYGSKGCPVTAGHG